MGQIETDAGNPRAAPWKLTPVKVLPTWAPEIGDTLTGEYSQPTGE